MNRLATDPAAELERDTRETGGYTIIKHSIGLGASYPYERRYEVHGDHLYVAELNTGTPVWVKLGSRRNPWIRVRVGDTLKRDFTTLWIRAKFDAEEENRFGTCLFYASKGPLLVRPRPGLYGLNRGFLTFGATLTTTQRSFTNLLTTASPNGAGLSAMQGFVDLGREPVSLWVTNMSAAGDFVYMGVGSTSSAPAIADMFAIPNQACVKFEIDSSLRGALNEVSDGSTVPDELYFASSLLAGIPARFMLSKFGFDVTRPDSAAAALVTTNGPRPFNLED